jgi:hypothetical protein
MVLKSLYHHINGATNNVGSELIFSDPDSDPALALSPDLGFGSG